MVERVAPTRLPVLIVGPTGVGKEIVARGIHDASGCKGRFVAIDCGALSETLVEAELFGNERGAFTGANRRRAGLVSSAHNGTFFLDEIGELTPSTQSRLLRLLEQGTYRPIGAEQELKADIRVVAATWRPLEEWVRLGKFRLDLYHRLCVVNIEIPPLSERREDIGVLFDYFLGAMSEEQDRSLPVISDEVRTRLKAMSWPGNVRELRNLAEYCCIMGGGKLLTMAELPLRYRQHVEHIPILDDLLRIDLPYIEARRAWLNRFQVAYVEKLLARYDGNVSMTARAAGMDRRSIQRILKRNHAEQLD